MKLNIAYPATGCQKTINIEEELRTRFFYDHRMGAEVPLDSLGPEYAGYVVKIKGGSDKQGFPMKQGILEKKRVRLLLNKNSGCYHPRRFDGERRRKSVRGCIVAPDIAVLDLIIVKRGEAELDGITNNFKAKRLGPKRANKIRKLYGLDKKDDPRKYLVRRTILKVKKTEEGEEPGPKKRTTKAPKVQRLVTPKRQQRRRRIKSLRRQAMAKSKQEEADYNKMIAQIREERRKARKATKSARKSTKSANAATKSE